MSVPDSVSFLAVNMLLKTLINAPFCILWYLVIDPIP